MIKRSGLIAAVLALALVLSGCQSAPPKEEEAPQAAPSLEVTQAPEINGELAQAVQALLSPYDAELSQVSPQSPFNLDYTIPSDLLRQMAADAAETGAKAEGGKYQFEWRQSGNYAYQSTSDDALSGFATEAPGATPDPNDETPMESQLMGDYAVSGGGLFDRVRAYNVSESLQSGTIEITDTLNGSQTGHEFFSFALRGDALYFADAVLDMEVNVDSVGIRKGYLAAVGFLKPDGLDIIEYRIDDLSLLPDPAALDWNQLTQSVEILSRLTAEGAVVTGNTKI